MISSACIALDSKDKGTVVPCHIHVSHVVINAIFVYKYFHICNTDSDLLRAADGCDKCSACNY
jgi:hypothetical protein